jgi:hypothetical protein
MKLTVTPIDWSSLIRGIGVGVIFGSYAVAKWEANPFRMLWIGVVLGVSGHGSTSDRQTIMPGERMTILGNLDTHVY